MTKLQALAVADILLSESRLPSVLYALAPEAMRGWRRDPNVSPLDAWIEHLDEADAAQASAQEFRLALAAVLEEIAVRLREGE